MENQAVVEADLAQTEEVLDVPGCDVRHELQANRPLVGGQLDRVRVLGEVDVLLRLLDLGLAVGLVHGASSEKLNHGWTQIHTDNTTQYLPAYYLWVSVFICG